MHPNSSPTPRVERRTHGAQRWQDVTADVLGWDGVTLTVRAMPESALIRGAAWRVNGREYRQTRVQTDGPFKVTLA